MKRPCALLAALAALAWPCTAAPPTPPIRPDPVLTPGDVLPTVTVDDLRRHGYSASVRDVPPAVKRQVYARYGITTWHVGEYEVDHLVPLSLGGSNSIRNLWPQSYAGPLGAHRKDALEDHLLALVRAGRLDLATAQHAIAADWMAAYRKYLGPLPPCPP